MKTFISFMIILLGMVSAQAQNHTLPTLDRNNNWTGVNTYILGDLQLGTGNQTCSGGQFMYGMSNVFTPLCTTYSTGVSSLNGLTGAVTILAGTNIGISVSGNNITLSASGGGGGGGGNLNTLANDLVSNNAGNTAAQDLYNFYATSTYLPQTAVNAAYTNSGVATLMPSASNTPFANTHNIKVDDLDHLGQDSRSATEWGAQCDTRQAGVTMTATSTTVAIYDDYFYPYDVGKTLVVVGTVGGVPTAFETVIASLPSSPSRGGTAIMTTAAPFTISSPGGSNEGYLGHDDTAALTQAFAGSSAGGTVLRIPSGNCMTHTLTYNGISITGLGINSAMTSFPGEDLIAEPDPAVSTPSPAYGSYIGNMSWLVNQEIDATLPWQVINDSGTTAKTALYRPGGINAVTANNPLAPGWFQGSGPNFSGVYNGYGAINSGSPTLVTVPAGLTLPTAGTTLVFPYTTNIFTTTVASVNTGTRVVTLNASYPGSTTSLAEYFAGVTPQTLNASVSSGTCPSTLTLTNSINPSPVSESNVAPYGMIKIDGEEFAYKGKTNAYNVLGGANSNTLVITGCAQNGTTRAAHSAGATVFPINPFIPNTPFPVFPTTTSGSTTPSVAAMYPSWNVGNTAFAVPNTNGNTGSTGVLGFANAVVENLTVNALPSTNPVNHTSALYIVGLPYNTHFRNIVVAGTYYGIIEGTPSYNTGGAFAASQPTADGTTWQGIRLTTCVGFDYISGGQNSFKDFNIYPNCYNGSAYTGADAGMYFTQGWNDEGGYPQAIQSNIDLHNMYEEAEFGTQFGWVPSYEFDISRANWDNLHVGSGTETYIGGNNQHFVGGNFNAGAGIPVINYGWANGSEYITQLGGPFGVSNTYGSSALINYGANVKFSGALASPAGLADVSSTPYSPNQLGNSRESWGGQSNETWNTGNVTVPFVNTNGGYIPSWEFNVNGSFEGNGFQVPWSYDSSLLPDGSIAGGNVGCILTTGTSCFSYRFNSGSGIKVGPGQRIVAGKYTLYIASKSSGAATQYQLDVGVCTAGDSGTFTIPVSSSYTIQSAQVDLTGKGTCGGGIGLTFNNANANDTIRVAYVDFAPVGQQPTDYNVNVLNQVLLSNNAGTPGQCLVSGGPSAADAWGTCSGGGGGGSVSSVGLAVPSWLTVSGTNPITSSGTFTIASANIAPGLVLASPATGSAGALTPRSLVVSDIPSLPYINALTGDITASGAGAVASTVTRLNGQSLAALTTGLLQNTTGTGIPTIANSYNLTGGGTLGTYSRSGVYTVPCTTTPVFDASQGDIQLLTLTAACGAVTSSSIANVPTGATGQQITAIVCQDSTGGNLFPNPTWAQGWTPVQLSPNQCTTQRLTVANGTVTGDAYNSAMCAVSGASPLACGNAYKGFITVAAGTNPTATINTTAIGANSIVLFTPDLSIGSTVSPTVTCNTTVPAGEVVTTKTVNTSFTVEVVGTFTTNPVCLDYVVVNP